jgi:hypothetical protein
MRHRFGMVLAVIMTAVLFFPGAWGYLRLLRLPAAAGQLSRLPGGGGSLIADHHVLVALAAIAGTGLLTGILIAVPRISPLAAGLPGLLVLGWTGLYLVSVRQVVDLIPLRSDPFGAGFEAMLFNGILGASGLAMITPMFVPSRWRARRAGQTGDLVSGPGDTTAAPLAATLADQPANVGLAPGAPVGPEFPGRGPGAAPGGTVVRHQRRGCPGDRRASLGQVETVMTIFPRACPACRRRMAWGASASG